MPHLKGPRPRAHRVIGVLAALAASVAAIGATSADDRPAMDQRPAGRVSPPHPSRALAVGWLAAANPAPAQDFGVVFTQRLQHEASRSQTSPGQPAADEDLEATATRSRRAERIFSRSLRSTLGDQFETMARSAPGIGDMLRTLDRFAGRAWGGSRHQTAAPDGLVAAAPAPVAAATAAGFAAGARLRLDAHPRLELRARAGSLIGTVEVPLLEREVRVDVEQPLGGVGRAMLRAGRSDARGGWADLAIAIRF
jgi:hypothetical protein